MKVVELKSLYSGIAAVLDRIFITRTENYVIRYSIWLTESPHVLYTHG